MKKILSVFILIGFMTPLVSWGAVVVQKAAPVATKKANALEDATSLVPSVVGLVTEVKSLSDQQKQLVADCAPSSSEISTVNDLIKEWAKIGDTDAESAASGLGGEQCDTSYKAFMEYAEGNQSCYEVFKSSADKGMIWENYPKVSSTKKCPSGDDKNCVVVSNMYDLFAKIPFTESDLTKSEWDRVSKIKEKSQKCTPANLKAAKAQLFSGFVTKALGNVGKSTGAAGTASVIQAVSSMGGSANFKDMLSPLSQMAVQSFDK